MTGRLVVDRERCLGTGVCVEFAPNTFAHDASATAVVLDPVGDPVEDIITAVEACPMSALHLVPDKTGA